MTNIEAEFRCQVAYEQLDKVYVSLITSHKVDDAEELLSIMRKIVIYSQRFHNIEDGE